MTVCMYVRVRNESNIEIHSRTFLVLVYFCLVGILKRFRKVLIKKWAGPKLMFTFAEGVQFHMILL